MAVLKHVITLAALLGAIAVRDSADKDEKAEPHALEHAKPVNPLYQHDASSEIHKLQEAIPTEMRESHTAPFAPIDWFKPTHGELKFGDKISSVEKGALAEGVEMVGATAAQMQTWAAEAGHAMNKEQAEYEKFKRDIDEQAARADTMSESGSEKILLGADDFKFENLDGDNEVEKAEAEQENDAHDDAQYEEITVSPINDEDGGEEAGDDEEAEPQDDADNSPGGEEEETCFVEIFTRSPDFSIVHADVMANVLGRVRERGSIQSYTHSENFDYANMVFRMSTPLQAQRVVNRTHDVSILGDTVLLQSRLLPESILPDQLLAKLPQLNVATLPRRNTTSGNNNWGKGKSSWKGKTYGKYGKGDGGGKYHGGGGKYGKGDGGKNHAGGKYGKYGKHW